MCALLLISLVWILQLDNILAGHNPEFEGILTEVSLNIFLFLFCSSQYLTPRVITYRFNAYVWSLFLRCLFESAFYFLNCLTRLRFLFDRDGLVCLHPGLDPFSCLFLFILLVRRLSWTIKHYVWPYVRCWFGVFLVERWLTRVKTEASGPVLCLETEDVEGAVEKAVSVGAAKDGEITEEEGACCGRVGKLKDPFGFTWCISSPAKKCADVEA